MKQNDIIDGLIAQREAIREKAEHDMAVLQDAIELLRFCDRSPVAAPETEQRSPNGATVTERIRAVLPEMAEPISVSALLTKCSERWPEELEKIKRGVYPTLTTLVRRRELEKCDGGFRRASVQ